LGRCHHKKKTLQVRAEFFIPVDTSPDAMLNFSPAIAFGPAGLRRQDSHLREYFPLAEKQPHV